MNQKEKEVFFDFVNLENKYIKIRMMWDEYAQYFIRYFGAEGMITAFPGHFTSCIELPTCELLSDGSLILMSIGGVEVFVEFCFNGADGVVLIGYINDEGIGDLVSDGAQKKKKYVKIFSFDSVGSMKRKDGESVGYSIVFPNEFIAFVCIPALRDAYVGAVKEMIRRFDGE